MRSSARERERGRAVAPSAQRRTRKRSLPRMRSPSAETMSQRTRYEPAPWSGTGIASSVIGGPPLPSMTSDDESVGPISEIFMERRSMALVKRTSTRSGGRATTAPSDGVASSTREWAAASRDVETGMESAANPSNTKRRVSTMRCRSCNGHAPRRRRAELRQRRGVTLASCDRASRSVGCSVLRRTVRRGRCSLLPCRARSGVFRSRAGVGREHCGEIELFQRELSLRGLEPAVTAK